MPTTASRGTDGNCRGTASRSQRSGAGGWNDGHDQSGSPGRASTRSSHAAPFRNPGSSIDTQPERNSLVRNRMREICTSGSVGGEGGNLLAYPALAHVPEKWVPVFRKRTCAKPKQLFDK